MRLGSLGIDEPHPMILPNCALGSRVWHPTLGVSEAISSLCHSSQGQLRIKLGDITLRDNPGCSWNPSTIASDSVEATTPSHVTDPRLEHTNKKTNNLPVNPRTRDVRM
jgi:hypothetical protein